MKPPITLESALLQLLAAEPAYGLQVRGRLVRASKGAIAPNNGRLYPALRSLEALGLLKTHEEPSGGAERGGLPRVVYSVTAAGAARARADRALLAEICDPPVTGQPAPKGKLTRNA